MWSWINGLSTSGTGSITIVRVSNVNADRTLIVPANYTILNVVIEQWVAPVVSAPFVSIGNNNPDYDDYVPSQEAIPSAIALDKNTILIDRTPYVQTTLTIHSAAWDGSYNFYFALIKYK
jgi:hypothetical protein